MLQFCKVNQICREKEMRGDIICAEVLYLHFFLKKRVIKR